MDHPGPEIFNELLKGYLQESLNPQELARFFELAAEPGNSEIIAQSFRKDLDGDLNDLSSPGQKQDAWEKLRIKIETNRPPIRRVPVALRWVAMLVCLLGATVAVYMFNKSKNQTAITATNSRNQTPAWLTTEHIGATLFLSNGDSLTLNNQDQGVIAKQDGIEVLQSGGSISYSGKTQTTGYNEIRTGKGKLWRAVLPDQTLVWLNGGSSIKYPLQFAANVRTVEMNGEIYFEVTHHADHPFRVKAGSVWMEDIGTSFNVRSFAGDTMSATTLVEGSVRVVLNDQQVTLSAGQQSLVSAHTNGIRIVQHANLTEALAWKNGFFYFQNAGLSDVMKQISEWYQVGVVYKGRGSGELFSGQIDKTLSLADVLKGLQQPGVAFTLDSSHRINVFQH